MKNKIALGSHRIGHVTAPDEFRDRVAYVEFTQKGATIELPWREGVLAAFERALSRDPVPSVIHYVDQNGHLTFLDCLSEGSSASTLGVSATRINSGRVVASGELELDYSDVDGVSTRIEGLANWAEISSVKPRLTFTGNQMHAIEIRAELQGEVRLGGSMNLKLASGFTYPQSQNRVHTIHDLLTARTSSEELVSFRSHAAVHGMLQDLMCLVFKFPCAMELATVKREDDQPLDIEGSNLRVWRQAHEPLLGRGGEFGNLSDKRKPLFRLKDADPDRIDEWSNHFTDWARPTWIAVTTMFQQNSTVEAELLQIGIALEAWGYARWNQLPRKGNRTPPFESLLKQVIDHADFNHPALYGEESPKRWRRSFNSLFMGIKHADNPLPDPVIAQEKSAQGLNILRCAVARQLGVTTDVLERALSHDLPTIRI